MNENTLTNICLIMNQPIKIILDCWDNIKNFIKNWKKVIWVKRIQPKIDTEIVIHFHLKYEETGIKQILSPN